MLTKPTTTSLRWRSPVARMLAAQTGLRGVLDDVGRVLGRGVDVLLHGESGTGKELIARLLHEADRQRQAAHFVAVNCAALPEGVLEAELFGVCRGAYTGADMDRPGLFRRAHGGTLFLDEVGEMPPALQAKLLRALQERCVRPLGGETEIPVDVRVVSATHQDLTVVQDEPRMRPDFFFRLADYIIEIPPLRHRRCDIRGLADVFLVRYRVDLDRQHLRGFTAAAGNWLRRQDWSANNVRELEVVVKRVVLKCDEPWIDIEHLQDAAGQTTSPLPAINERSCLEDALQHCNGNIAAAARQLGLKRSTLFDRLQRYGIQRPGQPRRPQ